MIHEARIKRMIAMFTLMHGMAARRSAEDNPIPFANEVTEKWVNHMCDVLCWVMDYPSNFSAYEKDTVDRINANPDVKAQFDLMMLKWEESVATANAEYQKAKKEHGGDLSKLTKEQIMEIANRMNETGEKDVIAAGHEFSRAGGKGEKDAEVVLCTEAPADGDLSGYEAGTVVTECHYCKKPILLSPSSPQGVKNVCLNCVGEAYKGEETISE